MSGPVAQEFETANEEYVAQFNNGHLPLPPARKVAVVVCMDARINPARALGLKEGDAHVIRNAGGRAVDALRSVVISQQLLGTREIVVIHHVGVPILLPLVNIILIEYCILDRLWHAHLH
jgi:carbonic anhydrase